MRHEPQCDVWRVAPPRLVGKRGEDALDGRMDGWIMDGSWMG